MEAGPESHARRRRRTARRVKAALVGGVAIFGLATLGVGAKAEDPRTPIPEKGFIEQVPAAPCAPESEFDMPDFYGAKCKRLKFVFGPLAVKPGQNDLLIEPVTIEKPAYDGYITRFKPNLIDQSGYAPPVEELHLHHATWLNLGRSYGDGPFMASGEEKTIPYWPQGYGMKVLKDDTWGLLHMIHNATPTPRVVWIIYDIDFVKAADAEAIQPDGKPLLQNTKNIWLDVGGGKFHDETETYPFNPIYNVQRGHGSVDPNSGNRTCSFPAENCSRYNSLGNVSAQQGKAVAVKGKDWHVPDGFLGPTGVGTLVVMGGHLHPGGIVDKVSLVRNGEERPIHTSEAYYWSGDGTERDGDPTSWDFSMTAVSKDLGWGILIKEGDTIRLNAEYDSEFSSWYENMGIVMTWVAPGDTSGVDPFAPGVTIEPDGYPTTAKYPPGMSGNCTPSATTICARGQITHTRYQENKNHGPCTANGSCPAIPASPDRKGPTLSEIDMGGFSYGPADFGVIAQAGLPQVKVGQPLKFVNADTADYMWHTATRCQEPCSGPTKVDYPIADGGNGSWDDIMDFDSSELGIGLYPAQRVDWTITPDKTGVYTFFCRIHPSMRGAVEVVQ
jgi:plastocyanin